LGENEKGKRRETLAIIEKKINPRRGRDGLCIKTRKREGEGERTLFIFSHLSSKRRRRRAK
jgi:hypothetical protein